MNYGGKPPGSAVDRTVKVAMNRRTPKRGSRYAFLIQSLFQVGTPERLVRASEGSFKLKSFLDVTVTRVMEIFSHFGWKQQAKWLDLRHTDMRPARPTEDPSIIVGYIKQHPDVPHPSIRQDLACRDPFVAVTVHCPRNSVIPDGPLCEFVSLGGREGKNEPASLGQVDPDNIATDAPSGRIGIGLFINQQLSVHFADFVF
jgi:hypothetical protein